MKKVVNLLCAFLAAGVLLAPSQIVNAQAVPGRDLVGAWEGALKVSGMELRIVFHVEADEDGGWKATMDSPDQGAKGIPVSAVAVESDTVRFEVAVAQGAFVGRLNEDASSIVGEWRQGGGVFPLTLAHVEQASEVRRPQMPVSPFPYEAEDVRFENAGAGLHLSGTLTYPKGEGPFPAAVLISGSGPQDRDETLVGHKPFLVLADYLTRRGIAVLRYDDRGTGQSTGDFSAATTEDLATDARAAVDFLKTYPRIDAAHIGLVGHSEGGLIAPIVAAATDDVAFAVLLAGPSVPGEDILYAQSALISRANGANEATLAKNRAVQEQVFAVLRSDADGDAAAEQVRTLMKAALAEMSDEERQTLGLSDQVVEVQIQQVVSPWFRYFLAYDPRPSLQAASVPVLALFGEKDLQVPPDVNVAEMEAALADAPEGTAVRVLPGLNHLFQTSETGAPSEYGRIEETFAPRALEAVGDWILEVTTSSR